MRRTLEHYGHCLGIPECLGSSTDSLLQERRPGFPNTRRNSAGCPLMPLPLRSGLRLLQTATGPGLHQRSRPGECWCLGTVRQGETVTARRRRTALCTVSSVEEGKLLTSAPYSAGEIQTGHHANICLQEPWRDLWGKENKSLHVYS